MKTDFLKRLQSLGWLIVQVFEERAVVRCPNEGCELKAVFKEDGAIPACAPGQRRSVLDIPVNSFDDFRYVLRNRRTDLGLTIREVEEVCGITVDYLAKFEKDDPSKIPNAQTLIEWVQGLGYSIHLRPSGLTPYALRTICDTRPKFERRTRRFAQEDQRRGAGRRDAGAQRRR